MHLMLFVCVSYATQEKRFFYRTLKAFLADEKDFREFTDFFFEV